MAGVLDFDQYIGGADEIKVEQIFPSNQRTLIYNFQQDITGWTFSADYQTLVIDRVSFNRLTGYPNFASSKVIGSFAKVDISGDLVPTVLNPATGLVEVHWPAGMYTGPIVPDARANVPITVWALTWSDDSDPVQTNTHRWALIQCWEPDVEVGDPVDAAGYTPFSL